MRSVIAARYVSVFAVVFAAIGAVLFFFIGAVTTIQAIGTYFGAESEEALSSDAALSATVEVVTALDQFLLGLFLVVFAFGVYSLFGVVDREQWESVRASMQAPDWLKVSSVTDLKVKLLEVVAVIVAVLFLKLVLEVTKGADLSWNALVLPIAVALFGLTVWFFRQAEDH
jgi:uncharacterized membrane protein YqhA